jgi:hypothetical protein
MRVLELWTGFGSKKMSRYAQITATLVAEFACRITALTIGPHLLHKQKAVIVAAPGVCPPGMQEP